MIRGRPATRGFALPLVLWLVAMLMAMLAVLAHAARVGHIQARADFDRTQAEAAARAGIAYAVARTDPALGDAAWGPSETPHVLAFDGWTITLRIRDEAGKFDLNRGDPAVLRTLLQVLEIPAGEAARIVDGVLSRRGPAASAGATLPMPGAGEGARADAFVSVSELQQWPDVGSERYQRLQDHLTVHAGQVRPQWRLASPVMRQVLSRLGDAQVDGGTLQASPRGSGTYAIESMAERPGRSPGRVAVVLRVSSRGGNGVEATWLAWEQGRWTQ